MKLIIAYRNGNIETETFSSRVEAEARLQVIGYPNIRIVYLTDDNDKTLMTGLWQQEWHEGFFIGMGHYEEYWVVKPVHWRYTA